MPDVEFTNLFGVLLVALAAPLLLGYLPRLRIPAVVLEILLGVVLGPSGLGWLHVDLVVQIVALLGLAMLLFLAGLEIDVRALRGRLLRLSIAGYAISIAIGLLVGLGASAAGWVKSPALLAVTLSATSLGLVVAVLKDAKATEAPIGQTTVAASSVADFAAVLLLSLVFSESTDSTGSRLLLLGLFAGLVLAIASAAAWSGNSMRLGEVLVRLQDSTAEIRVRAAMVLLIAFVVLAERFGLESILGAFMAGAAVGLLDRDAASHPHFRTKLDAIGFGLLIPVFFVSSGIRLDVRSLLNDPGNLALVPVFLVALLLVRGVPALLCARLLGTRQAIAAGLLQATSLPFIVTATQIGLLTGRMSASTAAALVCAGLLSVLVFPAAAVTILSQTAGPPPQGQELRRGGRARA